MSGVEMKTPPAGDRGRGEDCSHDPCKITANIPGTDGAGYGEGLLPFLLGWSEGGPWWPTAIPREGGGTFTATFTDPAKVTEWVDARRGADNLYFHVNDLSPNTRKKGDKGDVTRIRGFHVDIDARAPEGGWPQSEPSPERLAALRDHCASEHARIIRLVLDGAGWPANIPRPTAAVDSGGGCQCFFRLHDDEVVAPDAAEALNKMLAVMLDGDVTVVDVSRIMRLPGTMNLPGKKKRWRGRVDTATRLVLADWTRRFRMNEFIPGVVDGQHKFTMSLRTALSADGGLSPARPTHTPGVTDHPLGVTNQLAWHDANGTPLPCDPRGASQ